MYNLASQMIHVRAHGSGGATLASYEYDGNGRRVRITEGTTRRLQMYSQAGQLVYETTTIPGQPIDATEYYYLGRHLIAQKTNGVTKYIHTDALGSVTRKTDGTGMIVEDRIYEPYGESLEVTTRAPQWPQGMAYTGHVLDNLTRITYAQARYYDQLMGRFMSVDPVEPDPSSFNRYWYASNNPFTRIDPDGRADCTGTHIKSVCDSGGVPQLQGSASNHQDDVAEIYADYQRNFGRLPSAAAKLAQGSSDLADVIDEEAVATIKYGVLGGLPGRITGRVARILGLARETVSFGKNANQLAHTFRHVEGIGLNRDVVQRAIQADLRSSSAFIVAGKPFNRSIAVDGVEITYTAFRLEGGIINVGRITIPR
ncbi:Wall-associated protein [Dokdonella koreensis DS-123]|uniref:Wall-associated protein n=1 Tax=Dokdonella koreensis DS-123 TaxID=1300342 RepID=A0A160DS06_9GAMM|nr:Wall-associated protein [Dokdonella koreensis DS-123]